MASKKNLKKDLNYVMSDIIETAIIYQIAHPEEDAKETDAIIADAVSDFNAMITKINQRDVEHKGKHLKEVSKEIETKAHDLISRINAL
ncbi:hypothetical protein ACFSQ0_01410 [Mesonia sediminis]|uniref:Uncharacterized protein n=1 Tax=Mesonia sediminis TaxID=1703946 RepID=A0ABW5SA06_9FLAO